MPDPIVRKADAPDMDAGAPLPRVEASEGKLTLTYTAVAGPRVCIAFAEPLAHQLGPPNDEALAGHPLTRFGLTHYAAFEVMHSPWLAEIVTMNREHIHHADSMFDDVRHFVWTFHDSTFECLADSYSVKD